MSEREDWERHPGFPGMAGMLLGIHDSFRATSAALVRLRDGAADDYLERVRHLFVPLSRTLHHHHHAEEVMLFPLLLERTGERAEVLIEDHEALMARLDEVEAQLARGDRDGLPGLLATLDTELRDHLEREETTSVPVLLELTHAEALRLMYGIG